MTPAQIELARHALGLTRTTKAYRNYFVAGSDHDDYEDWMAMVADGMATRRDGAEIPFGGGHLFRLRRCAAEAIIRTDEDISDVNFPIEKARADG